MLYIFICGLDKHNPSLCSKSSTQENDLSGGDMITKKSLNKLTGHRTISIQEAVHEIADLELVLCSDVVSEVSLGKSLATLRKDEEKSEEKNKSSNDLIIDYRYRDTRYKHLSMENYFYSVFMNRTFYKDTFTKRNKYRILLPKGLNCRPRYPANYDYARGMLLLHIPWHDEENLDLLLRDKDATVKKFLDLVGSRTLPLYVLSEYHRAIEYSHQYQVEALAKEPKDHSDEMDLNNYTEEELEMWEHSRHLSTNMTTSNTVGDMMCDIGIDHDWSKSFFHGSRNQNTSNGELYTEYLKGFFYENTTQNQQNTTDGCCMGHNTINEQQ